MKQKKAEELTQILDKTAQAESILLVKRNKNIEHNLKQYLKYKRKIAEFEGYDDGIPE